MFGPTAILAAASSTLLGAGAADFILGHLGWFVGGAIVVIGVVYGLSDLRQLSASRIWAISSVSFSESIRRRVLLITPLAILGILGVSQFLDPVDPADAIRQITKVCLFATGLVVTVLAIILACTNLPKEIDSRVIYTIVTKPTTRLEIVLGKVLGFARVSAAILLIMGLFTLVYLHLKAWRAESWVKEQAAANPNDPALQNLARGRLLATRSLAEPAALNIFARPPVGTPPTLAGGESQFFLVPFDLTAEQKDGILNAVNGGGALMIINTLGYEQAIPTPEEQQNIRDMKLPTTDTDPSWAGAASGALGGGVLPGVPSTLSVPLPIPQVTLRLYDRNFNRLLDDEKDKPINNGEAVSLPFGGDKPKPAPAFLSPLAVQKVIDAGQFYVAVEGKTPTITYIVGQSPTVLAHVSAPGQQPVIVSPAPLPAPNTPDNRVSADPSFQSHRARYGMQIRGRANGRGAVAAYSFQDARVPRAGPDGNVMFETRIGIESATDFDSEANITPRMNLTVYNRDTRQTSPPIPVNPESGQITRAAVPAAFVQGGNFDVFITGLNEGMWYGVEIDSLSAVRAQRSFALNLLKSLFIIWLMAVLVVIVALFTSTFLSWPIAAVLTVMILLGHWGVEQVGDASGPGLGAEVTQAMGMDNPTGARIVRTSVGAVSRAMNFLAIFLPDLSKFAAMEHIERGVSIPAATVAAAGRVLLGYGVPVLLLAYLVLRNKEVAP